MRSSVAIILATIGLSCFSTFAVPLKRATGVTIRLNSTQDYCLASISAPANDVYLTAILCTDIQTTNPAAANYGLWDIAPGDQLSIRLSGSSFCLDAGLNPGPGQGIVKLYTCYPGAPQQRWFYTDDLHIAISGGNTCVTWGRYGIYTYGCGLLAPQQGQQTFAIVSLPTTPPTNPNPPSNPNPPTTTGRQLHWNGDNTKCLSVSGGDAGAGTLLVIANCLASTDVDIKYQSWVINRGSGQVQLASTDLCIDAGSSPGNGIRAKVWTCYNNLFQQTFYYTDDNHIAIQGGNQCLDVQAESLPTQTKPYGSLKDVQFWGCYSGANQVFTL